MRIKNGKISENFNYVKTGKKKRAWKTHRSTSQWGK